VEDDRLVYRIVVGALGLAVLVSIGGLIALTFADETAPEGLVPSARPRSARSPACWRRHRRAEPEPTLALEVRLSPR